jgi:hypothetical protein
VTPVAKKKKKKFGAVERARLGAREAVGMPPPTRAVPARKHKPPKHKKRLIEEELEEL